MLVHGNGQWYAAAMCMVATGWQSAAAHVNIVYMIVLMAYVNHPGGCSCWLGHVICCNTVAGCRVHGMCDQYLSGSSFSLFCSEHPTIVC